MNPLLARQLAKHLPGLDATDPRWGALLTAVSASYDEADLERRLLEHTLEVTSEDLHEANERLRRDSEARLRSLEGYYQHVLEEQLGMILCVRREDGRDGDGPAFRHTLCRGELARRLGWTPSAVEGRRAADFLPPAAAAALDAAYARAWAGEECTHEGTSADGAISFLARLMPHREGGEVREVILSGVEITDRKLAERELVAARDRAQAADRVKTEFLAAMSHEIRTPLNAVLGFTSLLLETQLTAEQREWLLTIDQSGEALLSLINDVLDLSKIDDGHVAIDAAECDPAQLLGSVAALYVPRATQKGITLVVDPAPNLPMRVVTDETRLRQIVINLTANALKFTPAGRVTLSAALDSAPPDAAGRRLLRFAVADTGIGIEPEARCRLFRPFGQADADTARHYGGTGLGLAICQRLVTALGGTIDYTSEPGVGSTFTFTIRATVLPDTLEEQRCASITPFPSARRVLVVEDNATNRRLIAEVLRRYGIEPDTVGNGMAAVAAAQECNYELIFMDVLMPELDGLEATRQIRTALEGRPQPRIVALTASVFAEQPHTCFAAGMDAVLMKPVRLEAIAAELARLAIAEPLD